MDRFWDVHITMRNILKGNPDKIGDDFGHFPVGDALTIDVIAEAGLGKSWVLFLDFFEKRLAALGAMFVNPFIEFAHADYLKHSVYLLSNEKFNSLLN